MTWPFENDTNAIVKRLSQRNFKSNIKHNKVMIVAITLVTLMMFTIFSVGISFYQNYTKMNIRIVGTEANEIITNLTGHQIQELQQLKDVSPVGSQIFSDYAVTENGQIALMYYDNAEWEHHIKNTVDQIVGTFPEEKMDIMLSEDTLNLLGIDDPFIGMEITLKTGDTGTPKTFILCGWYHDYISISRSVGSLSGNVAAAGLYGIRPDSNAIISEAYAIEHVLFRVTTCQTTSIRENELQNTLMLTDGQKIVSINNSSSGSVYGILAAIIGGLFIAVCGYLLIYNLAYISINKDIHFYGVLKALGTTSKQIKRIVRRQIKLLSFIAIPMGLIGGCVVSIWAVPFILNNLLAGGELSTAMEYTVSFDPIIFFFTIVFSCITVVISCFKPAKEAAKISPIAAIRFIGADAGISKDCRVDGGNSTKLWRMAFLNVLRNSKRAMLVFLSLFMGLTIFLMVYTVFSNPDWEMKERTEMPFDLMLNDMTLVHLGEQTGGQIDLEILQQLSAIQGICEQENVYGSICRLEGTDSVWTPYLDDKAKTGYADKEELEQNSIVQVNGITSTLLRKIPLAQGSYEEEMLSEFESGNVVYLTPTRSGFVPQNIVGSEITITDSLTGQSASYQIAGVFSETDAKNLQIGQINYININSTATYELSSDYVSHLIGSVFMSESGIKKLNGSPLVGQVFLNVDDSLEKDVKQQVKNVIYTKDIDMMSTSDSMDMYKESLASILLMGTVFSCLLLFIGIVNFVNTITTTIYSRQRELAILESIGMTKKQICRMISLEGEIYAGVSLVLLVVLGIPLTYGVVYLLREEFYFIAFRPPIIEIGCIALAVMFICFIVPRRTFRQISKSSIIERLQTTE